jgi:hypothetical protein
MGLIITVFYVLQLLILAGWLINCLIDGEREYLPTLFEGILLSIVPFGGIIFIFVFLYKNDKKRKEN